MCVGGGGGVTSDSEWGGGVTSDSEWEGGAENTFSQ